MPRKYFAKLGNDNGSFGRTDYFYLWESWITINDYKKIFACWEGPQKSMFNTSYWVFGICVIVKGSGGFEHATAWQVLHFSIVFFTILSIWGNHTFSRINALVLCMPKCAPCASRPPSVVNCAAKLCEFSVVLVHGKISKVHLLHAYVHWQQENPICYVLLQRVDLLV